jgi:hypothetical protein
MAAVTTSTERSLNRLAIVGVLIVTMIFLAPIYWIASTAFKPRNLATTVPPTVVFTPEVSPFVKLFTRRSQLRAQPTPEEYAAAPWWERIVFDGGEKIVRSGKGEIQWSGYPNRFMNSLIVAIVSTVLAVGMGTLHRLWFLALQDKGGGGPALLHPIDAHAAARRRGDPDVPDVPRGRAERYALGPDHPLYRLQPFLLGLAHEGFHGRDPEGV